MSYESGDNKSLLFFRVNPKQGYKVRPENRDLHRLASGSMGKIGRNTLARAIRNRFIYELRALYALSVGDIRDIGKRSGIIRSSSTISDIVKPLNTRIRRIGKGWSRYDIKVKLQKKADLIARWIRYILRTKITYIEGLTELIEKDIEPP